MFSDVQNFFGRPTNFCGRPKNFLDVQTRFWTSKHVFGRPNTFLGVQTRFWTSKNMFWTSKNFCGRPQHVFDVQNKCRQKKSDRKNLSSVGVPLLNHVSTYKWAAAKLKNNRGVSPKLRARTCTLKPRRRILGYVSTFLNRFLYCFHTNSANCLFILGAINSFVTEKIFQT